MCGIAGFVTPGKKADEPLLSLMTERLQHRGPDDQGSYCDGPFALGHTRLSIIDLEGGHQPLISKDGDLALVANGEIYNYVELREPLANAGADFATHSDCETILQAYRIHGRDFLERLNGMFAFALYDRRAGKLILARDRLGIKPLYYTTAGGRFAFASEIKALLPVLPVTPEINPNAFHEFLQNQFSTGEETIFRDIKRLRPGEAMAVDANLNIENWRYWSAADVQPRKCNFDEAREEFEPLMEQVMREHMRADVPFGLFLSGGVDSAVLLSLLDRFQNRPIRSFSVGYKDVSMKDELSDAEIIAAKFNTQHTPLMLDRDTVFKRIPHMIWATDDLMRDYACLPTNILAEHAAQELKVVFSGEGGDEAFAGYGRHRNVPFKHWFKNVVAPGSGGFRTRGNWHRPWRRRVFSDRLRAAQSHRTPFIKAWQSTPDSWSDLQRRQYIDISTALPDNLLVKADRMLMAFGLEGRVPFCDHRIVEFGLSLPDKLTSHGRQGKLFLKRWAESYLPQEHLYRKKRGFHVPIGEWFCGSFLDQLEDKLFHNVAINTWFQPAGVTALFAAQRRNGRASRELWCLMQFAIWHNLFIENPGRQPGLEENPLDWIC